MKTALGFRSAQTLLNLASSIRGAVLVNPVCEIKEQKHTKANNNERLRLLIRWDTSKSAHKNRHFLGSKGEKAVFQRARAKFGLFTRRHSFYKTLYCLDKLNQMDFEGRFWLPDKFQCVSAFSQVQ
jgi:hypothetical protein